MVTTFCLAPPSPCKSKVESKVFYSRLIWCCVTTKYQLIKEKYILNFKL